MHVSVLPWGERIWKSPGGVRAWKLGKNVGVGSNSQKYFIYFLSVTDPTPTFFKTWIWSIFGSQTPPPHFFPILKLLPNLVIFKSVPPRATIKNGTALSFFWSLTHSNLDVLCENFYVCSKISRVARRFLPNLRWNLLLCGHLGSKLGLIEHNTWKRPSVGAEFLKKTIRLSWLWCPKWPSVCPILP